MKTILILVDGMRPDALDNIEIAQKIIKKSTYTMNAQTVFPSVTLPCLISLFHSVAPDRHGTTTNVYTPQVRPIRGICEVLKGYGIVCAIIFSPFDKMAEGIAFGGEGMRYLYVKCDGKVYRRLWNVAGRPDEKTVTKPASRDYYC